jgi:hypothetical protein
MAAPKHGPSHGPILNNPGWVAAIFGVIVLAGFLGLLVNSANGHHEGGHGGGEHAAPAGSAPAEHH